MQALKVVRIVLFDAPAFIIGTWLRLYTLVLAVVCFILWTTIIVSLARFAWASIR